MPSARPGRAGCVASPATRISSLPRLPRWRTISRLQSHSRASGWRTISRPSGWPCCSPRCWRSGCVLHPRSPKPALQTRPCGRPGRRSAVTMRRPEQPSRNATDSSSPRGRTTTRWMSGSSTSSCWPNRRSVTRWIGNCGRRCRWRWSPPADCSRSSRPPIQPRWPACGNGARPVRSPRRADATTHSPSTSARPRRSWARLTADCRCGGRSWARPLSRMPSRQAARRRSCRRCSAAWASRVPFGHSSTARRSLIRAAAASAGRAPVVAASTASPGPHWMPAAPRQSFPSRNGSATRWITTTPPSSSLPTTPAPPAPGSMCCDGSAPPAPCWGPLSRLPSCSAAPWARVRWSLSSRMSFRLGCPPHLRPSPQTAASLTPSPAASPQPAPRPAA